MRLNKKEAALVLAGLRLLQRHWQKNLPLPDGIQEILDDGRARFASLTRVDELCEKINKP